MTGYGIENSKSAQPYPEARQISSMQEDVLKCVALPPDAAASLRRHLGLAVDDAVRIVYVAGPGDVVGTFDHWTAGRFDPRVPVIAYSTQFYALVDGLHAGALILHEHENPPAQSDPRFRFISISRDRSGGRLRYMSQVIRFCLRALRTIRDYDPHIVLVGTDCPLLLTLLMPKRMRLILSAHNTYWPVARRPTAWRARLKLVLVARMLRRIRAAVCTSPECARQIADLRGSGTGLFVQTPQIPHHHMPVAAPDEGTVANRQRLIFLGRIETNKGVFDLLDVFESLALKHPAATLVLAGSGGAAQILAERIAGSPHAGRIRFVGHLSGNAVHNALAEADLLICPTRSSFNEGLAMVVIEASAHGVPALVSSVVPAKDLFEGACAVFVADDIADLRMRLDALLSDPAAFAGLRTRVLLHRNRFLDRSKSWGSALYDAFLT